MGSQLFRDYLSGQIGEAAYLVALVTVTGRNIATPLRLNSTSHTDVLSRGSVYYRSGFDAEFPDRLNEGEQRTKIILPVLDPWLLSTIRAHGEQLTLTLEFVLTALPDTVELGPYVLLDRGGRTYDANTQTLTIEATFGDQLSHPRPNLRYSPGACPGLFNRNHLPAG